MCQIGHVISFIANWTIFGVYGLWTKQIFTVHLWPFWPIHHLNNPQANTNFLRLGDFSGLPELLAPQPTTGVLGPTPFAMGFRAEMAFLDHLAPLHPIGPFCLNPMRQKGPTTNPKGQVALKPQVGPPEPVLAPNSISLKNGHKDTRTPIGHFQPLASGNHQRPPAQAQQAFPSIKGKDSPSPMYSIPRVQEWCIYGIIYHYAPTFLRTPIVMVSGQNYAI
ncbi:hypothetical protein O181_049004 [Austropuccinia psidii MF-1]|uniref:Uncharacterized protein n=1 Tax=Austropuccinia psidii MF-1 TaxID=1389203 RepID=A0A9Q3HNE8_9BASI|nr:hypothetical protein [Austropuccinia psidii MF-1]